MSNTLQLALALCVLAVTVAFLVWFFIKFESALSGVASRAFGANWRTTLWGSINNLAVFAGVASGGLMAAYANPTIDPTWWFIIKLIPQHALPYIMGVAGLVKLVSGFLASRAQKSSEVQGGIVTQDAKGNVALPTPPTPPPVPAK